MQLSEHFSLDEMTYSATAKALGLGNTPGQMEIDRLRLLCINVLEPVRAHFGRPIKVNSGFRSIAVNRAVGSSLTSQHLRGEAADFEVPGTSNAETARWIRDNIVFDQLILENHRRGDPASGWVHCSWRAGRARKSVLTMTLGSHGPVYTNGIGEKA